MKKFLPLLLVLASPAFAQTSPPSSNLDGEWHGRSDGGSCNAPLDYQISIDTGIVDGTAYDATARGPVPNLKKTAPPAPTPGLWQIHGVARGGSFSLMTLASVKSEDRRSGKLTVTSQGASLVVVEQGGCGRKATLTR
jgi:hypothetical protein